MTVEIRALKLSKTLFNQLVSPDLRTNHPGDYEVLGWVFIKERFIIVHDKRNNVLNRIRPILITGRLPDGCTVTYKSGKLVGSKRFQNFLEADRWMAMMRRFMAESIEKGQIFL